LPRAEFIVLWNIQQAMNTPPNREVEVFNAALELDASKRGAYLDEACGDDPVLRVRLAALLRVHDEAIPFLESRAPGTLNSQTGAEAPGATIGAAFAPCEKAGDRIGRYKLLQQIGEGGCGVVYMAEQEEPVRRRVALKVIKLGMDTRQVVARFEAERQALALMDHPNIAKVFDAGATETGRPYFVMELVRGIKITDYCDENHLGTEQRLRLFVQVCQAIQHAHQKGIIHRDIKPSNVLVADHDGVPVPKIIDFGIAKATTDQRLTDKTLFTAFEQFIGTPAYMSPEQARMSGLDIDTRTDIYSLGVLLYELLTGKTPFDPQDLLAAGLDEMRRTISETEPPQPSTRLSTMPEAELTTAAKHRRTEPAKLGSLIRGDLDWIVMKALEKDRARRYETANGLAADILRHMNCEPVVARPPSRLYEFQKTVRRHKFGFAAAAALILVLLAGVLVSMWQAIRATKAVREQSRLRQVAETKESKSQQVARLLKDMLRSAGPDVALGRDTTLLRGILDRTTASANTYLTNQPEVQGELLSISGGAYASIGEYAKAEAAYRQALAIRRKVLGKDHPELAATLVGLADMLAGAGRHAESEVLFRESLQIRRKVYGNEDWIVAGCLNNMTGPLAAQGKLAEAEAISREALAMKRKLLSNDLAAVSIWTNADQALAAKRQSLANGDGEVAISLRDLGLVLRTRGKLAEAESMLGEALATFRRALGDQHPEVAFTLNGLSDVLARVGRLAEAETAQREALAIQRKLYDANSSHLVGTINGLEYILKQEGKVEEARALSTELQAMQRSLWDKLQSGVLSPPQLVSRLVVYGRRGQWKEALADAATLVNLVPGEHFNYHFLAPLQAQVGDLDGYRQTCRRAVVQFRDTKDPNTAERMAKDCLLLPDAGADLSVASAWTATAVSLGKDSGDLPWFQFARSLAEYRQGHFAGAVDWAQKALSHAGDDLNRDVEAYLVLAMAQHRSQQVEQASVSFAKGVELVEKSLPKLESNNLEDGWLDWLIAHILLREAQALIEGKGDLLSNQSKGM
jgi:eukaryotic-like serine/threonine-protein kinase